MQRNFVPRLLVVLAVLFAATQVNAQNSERIIIENNRNADIVALFSNWVNAPTFGATRLAPGQRIPANATTWFTIRSRQSDPNNIWCVHDMRLEFSDNSFMNIQSFNICDIPTPRLVVN